MSQPHYFSPEPQGREQRRRLRVRLPFGELEVETAAGVFSGDRVDAGTAVLLDHVPPPPSAGDLLDLGCGWGPLALSLAAASPTARVWAVDVNARARVLTADNAARAGLRAVRVAAPEEVGEDVRFAAIWSNPPVRVGKAALHELLQRWLARLDEGALAHLVVQKHLGADSLHRWLAEQGWQVERVGSARGYRVLAVGAAPPA